MAAEFPVVEKVKARVQEIRKKIAGGGGGQILTSIRTQGVIPTVKEKLAEFHRRRAEALAGPKPKGSSSYTKGSISTERPQGELKLERRKIAVEL